MLNRNQERGKRIGPLAIVSWTRMLLHTEPEDTAQTSVIVSVPRGDAMEGSGYPNMS